MAGSISVFMWLESVPHVRGASDLGELARSARIVGSSTELELDAPHDVLLATNDFHLLGRVPSGEADRGLRVLICDGMREVSADRWEGASDRASHTAFLELVFGWSVEPTTRVPDGESGLEVLEQLDGVVDEAVRDGVETVAMVSHGVAIRVGSPPAQSTSPSST
ncbi:histidine phosphatase family protein [Streptomyces sp. NPDC012616]|uniref:histidine phosphatase family protein n=1 Tax=Streptomyces sp. NPDC012616 TaxID=3364840 RepID=UPI0036E36FC6